ncbi:guanylate kinase [Micromonospora sp. WMMD1102]|uniref:guanylate kinase n=1 Tax=Micromonospora sp. WMMD1102 TaxID=3016105 RepID=UPI0024150FCC|nr:guanylate kinase [Micromonospora sp. WMMD1102]MDG4788236.1 guanylate kinase [Micromonospora sp. WMMD1102]
MGTHDDVRPAARLTVLAGPSGAGKDSVTQLVRARLPRLWLSVPVTTRPARRHEIDGVHYHFVDRAEFGRLLDGGELLEWSDIGVHRYGTPAGPVRLRLSTGRPVLLPIDLRGARQVRTALPSARLVYLAPTRADADAAGREFDATVVNDVVGRAADELVSLLGSSFLTPT